MEITVRAQWAERYMGSAEKRLSPAGAITALEAAMLAGIPEDEIGMLARDGVKIDGDARLANGAVIQVYPVIIGG